MGGDFCEVLTKKAIQSSSGFRKGAGALFFSRGFDPLPIQRDLPLFSGENGIN